MGLGKRDRKGMCKDRFGQLGVRDMKLYDGGNPLR